MPYDVSADGQRFLINERAARVATESAPPQPEGQIVVVNWPLLLAR